MRFVLFMVVVLGFSALARFGDDISVRIRGEKPVVKIYRTSDILIDADTSKVRVVEIPVKELPYVPTASINNLGDALKVSITAAALMKRRRRKGVSSPTGSPLLVIVNVSPLLRERMIRPLSLRSSR